MRFKFLPLFLFLTFVNLSTWNSGLLKHAMGDIYSERSIFITEGQAVGKYWRNELS